MKHLHGTSMINAQGHLQIGGCDTVELAKEFGTPLYVVDEALVRQRCREFMTAFRETGLNFQVAYASKAFCVMAMCRLIEEEGLSLDVVSDGELYTALQAGFPVDRIHFHGNNKTPDELEMAVDAGIGCVVVDNFEELTMLDQIAGQRGQTVNILIRLTPGVEAETHDFISTGQSDSKFGFNLDNGSAYEAVQQAIKLQNIRLLGVHSHIGSQIFGVAGFAAAIDKVVDFAWRIKQECDYTFKVLNLGGGFGIRYTNEDQPLAPADYVKAMADRVNNNFAKNDYPLPDVWIEPGRSIIGEAGTTLYTVGSRKEIPDVNTYVSVDGGMTDNIRPALYGSKYDAILANRAHDQAEEQVTIAGKACESGDKLIHDLPLPRAEAGDIVAVFSTGAYNYAMASNYNRIRRPAVVFVNDGQADIVVQRESREDIVRNDVIPARFQER